jgi:hypothetical protein
MEEDAEDAVEETPTEGAVDEVPTEGAVEEFPREGGLFVDERPEGTERYVWNGNPAKLHMSDLNDPKTGKVVLRYGDQVDLTPEQQVRYAHYIEKDLLAEEQMPTPRVSPHTPRPPPKEG